MLWTEARVDSVLRELIEENPLAIRPVLKLARRRFSDEVPTLAVTLAEPPELLINFGFIQENCKTEEHLKAVLYHEFLHVILGHTMRFREMSDVQNLALDAVINAIIFRQCGPEYASVFSEYYASQTGIGKLLRPMSDQERQSLNDRCAELDLYAEEFTLKTTDAEMLQVFRSGADQTIQIDLAWHALYEGTIISDDVLELAESLAEQQQRCADEPQEGSSAEPQQPCAGEPQDGRSSVSSEGALVEGKLLIGNHAGHEVPSSSELIDAIEESLRQMNGGGIWRAPGERGVGAYQYQARHSVEDIRLDKWKAQAIKALRKALEPDRRSQLTDLEESSYRIPVLSTRDRRAFLKAGWSPFIPVADNACVVESPLGWANVYLDVSGSMDAELPLVISLLHQLRKSIRMPFWAFSTEVSPARIERGQLITESTGGTSMECVLLHIAKTKPKAAVVVTDGYIEPVDKGILRKCDPTRITAIVTRDGSPSLLEQAGIGYIQLEAVPQ